MPRLRSPAVEPLARSHFVGANAATALTSFPIVARTGRQIVVLLRCFKSGERKPWPRPSGTPRRPQVLADAAIGAQMIRFGA